MARLIDADKIPYEECYVPGGDIQWGYKKALIAEKAVIDQIPTVDAAPVVHGCWIDEYPFVRCSVCNAEWLNCKTDNEPMLFYYCPNCGANMDLEVE